MKYIGKKMITLCITLLIVSFLAFFAFSIIPGDPAVAKLGTEATPERVEALRMEMGLNRSVLVRYADWLGDFVRGDMGTSYSYNMPVSEMIMDKFPITVALSGMAFIFMVITAIPLGIYSAKHSGGKVDRGVIIFNQIIMSIPPFFAGILITYFFGLVLKWFTPGNFVSFGESPIHFFAYLIAPAIAIALPKAAMTVKLLRSSLIEESKKEYARTAYSKGNTTNGVLYQHLLKNALIPVITFWGMAITDMIAGSVIIEQVFGIPGLGRILLASISNRDYPVVQGVVVLIAGIVIVVNLFVDVIYRVIDPRMRKSE